MLITMLPETKYRLESISCMKKISVNRNDCNQKTKNENRLNQNKNTSIFYLLLNGTSESRVIDDAFI